MNACLFTPLYTSTVCPPQKILTEYSTPHLVRQTLFPWQTQKLFCTIFRATLGNLPISLSPEKTIWCPQKERARNSSSCAELGVSSAKKAQPMGGRGELSFLPHAKIEDRHIHCRSIQARGFCYPLKNLFARLHHLLPLKGAFIFIIFVKDKYIKLYNKYLTL